MSNLMKIPSVGAELFNANRRTDRHDIVNFANVPNNAVRSLAWLWKQGIPPKHWHLSNKFLDVTSHRQKTIKLTVIVYSYRGLTHKQDGVVRSDHATVDGSNMDFAAI
jgi:hypothetical protein